MDLGIAGRKAMVCASSRGLGRACAFRLAEAGCEVTVNGLDAKRLEAAGPHFRDFRELDRAKMIEGAIGNMVVPIELIQKAIDGMVARKFGRIVNITSGSVKMPIVGLDLSSGARAGLTAFLAGVARSVAQHNVTINFLLPGPFDTDRLRSNNENTAKKQGITLQQAEAARAASIPARRFGNPDEFGAACAFLCSSHAGFITGQNLLMDGGIFPGAF